MCWNRVWAQTPKVLLSEGAEGEPVEEENVTKHQYPLSPSILTPDFPFSLEDELKTSYLTYLYPYEWFKRKELLPKETTTT